MQKRQGQLTFSPSDLTGYLACPHLIQLERRVALGQLAKPEAENPEAELVKRKGEEHERAYLERLRAAGKTVAEISLEPDHDWERAARETRQAIEAQTDVVYQGVLVSDDGWRGIADFLERQADGTYEAVDTKLARHAKPAYILQLLFYSEELARIQGREPARMHVELGSGERASYRPDEFAAYYRRLRSRYGVDPDDPMPDADVRVVLVVRPTTLLARSPAAGGPPAIERVTGERRTVYRP